VPVFNVRWSNTLVLDCEGAFYWILKDMPDILNNIEKILMDVIIQISIRNYG
jgi:hypothetical protein